MLSLQQTHEALELLLAMANCSSDMSLDNMGWFSLGEKTVREHLLPVPNPN